MSDEGTQDEAGSGASDLEAKVQELQNKLSEFRNTNIEYRQRLEKLGEIDPDEYKSLKEEARQREIQRQKDEGDFERIIGETKEQYEQRLAQKDEKLSSVQAQLEQHLKKDTLEREMLAQGLVPDGLDVAISHAERFFQTTERDDGSVGVTVVDKDGKPRYNSDGDPMTPAEWVEEFGQSKVGQRLFSADIRTGSGAVGRQGAGGTPRGTGELTREQKIQRVKEATAAGHPKPWEVNLAG